MTSPSKKTTFGQAVEGGLKQRIRVGESEEGMRAHVWAAARCGSFIPSLVWGFSSTT